MVNTANIHLANLVIWAGIGYYALQNIDKNIHFMMPLVGAFILLVMTNGIRDGVKQHAKVALVAVIGVLAFLAFSSIPHYYMAYKATLELGLVCGCFISGLVALWSYISFVRPK